MEAKTGFHSLLRISLIGKKHIFARKHQLSNFYDEMGFSTKNPSHHKRKKASMRTNYKGFVPYHAISIVMNLKASPVFTALINIIRIASFWFAYVYSKANYSGQGGQLSPTQNHCGNVSILISCQPRLPLQMVHKWNVAEHDGIPKS